MLKTSLSILVFARDVDRYSVNMLREIERMGHAVHVVTEPLTHVASKDWSNEVSIVERVRLKGRFDKNAAQRYADNVTKYAADVCMCYTSRALSVALTAKRRHGFTAPIVGSRGAIGGVSAFYLQDWFTYLSPQLDAVTCMSKAIADKLSHEAHRFWKQHPGQFETIYPGYGQLMDGRAFPQPKNRQTAEAVRLLCIANDRPIKGIAVLLDAVEHHVKSSAWTLDIVGQCSPQVIARIQSSAKLAQHVVAHGYRSDVPDFLASAHIYIQPTLFPGEGIGNSMAEAMSHGLPVITSNVGGGIELTQHGESGIHFEVGQASALGQAIDQLIAAPELCDRLGLAAAQALQDRFSLRQEATEFLNLFQRLLTRAVH